MWQYWWWVTGNHTPFVTFQSDSLTTYVPAEGFCTVAAISSRTSLRRDHFGLSSSKRSSKWRTWEGLYTYGSGHTHTTHTTHTYHTHIPHIHHTHIHTHTHSDTMCIHSDTGDKTTLCPNLLLWQLPRWHCCPCAWSHYGSTKALLYLSGAAWGWGRCRERLHPLTHVSLSLPFLPLPDPNTRFFASYTSQTDRYNTGLH